MESPVLRELPQSISLATSLLDRLQDLLLEYNTIYFILIVTNEVHFPSQAGYTSSLAATGKRPCTPEVWRS